MKRTVELDEKLVEEATRVAEAHGSTVTTLLEDALREKLSHIERFEEILRSFPQPGPGLQPGIDLDDHAAMDEIMDRDDPLIRQIKIDQRRRYDPAYAAEYARILASMPKLGEGGLLPGVDLDDHAAMDELDGLNDHP